MPGSADAGKQESKSKEWLLFITGSVSYTHLGYYNDAFEKVAATSPFNEVVMLLAMKKNQEAWDKISDVYKRQGFGK